MLTNKKDKKGENMICCSCCGFTYESGESCPACGSSKKNVEPKAIEKNIETELPNNQDPWQATFELTEKASVIIYGITDNTASKGTGFFIELDGEPLILTNYHVIAEGDNVVVEFLKGVDPTNQRYQAEVVAIDELNDLAMLKLHVDIANIVIKADRKFLKLANEESIKVGQEVCSRGNPSAYTNVLTVGRISGFCEGGENNNMGYNRLMVNIDATNGNSGSAVCNINGEVVGIITSTDSSMQYNVFCGTLLAINQMLAMYKYKKNLKG